MTGFDQPQRRLNVLLVEDDDIDAKIVTLCLSQFKARKVHIHRARSANEARQKLQSEDIDLVILDFWLGNESSLKLLSEVGGKGGLLPAIVLSGLSTPQTRQIVLKNGALAFLGKDHLSSGALEDVVESALQSYATDSEAGPHEGLAGGGAKTIQQVESRFNDILGFLDQMHERAMLADMLPEQRVTHLKALETLADDARAVIFSGMADLRHQDESADISGPVDLRSIVDEVHELTSALLSNRRQSLTCIRPDVKLFASVQPRLFCSYLAEIVALVSRLSAEEAVLSLSTHYNSGQLCITVSGVPRLKTEPVPGPGLGGIETRLAAERIGLVEDLQHPDGPTITLTLPSASRSVK